MTMILIENALAAVEYFSMQTVLTDTIIKATIVVIHHVSEEIRFKYRFLAGCDLAGRIGHLGSR